MAVFRVNLEAAFVLHRYDWSESSLILDVFTRHHGRVPLLAKGVKKPSSSFRPVLLPLQPLRISFGGDAEIRTLKSAEWQGGHVMPTGEALMSGYYLNELLMRLLAREDPHPALFDAYAATVAALASGGDNAQLQLALRAFELKLLHEVGLLPQLNRQTTTQQALELQTPYVLVPEVGLREAHEDDAHSLPGCHWHEVHTALHQHTLPRLSPTSLQALKNQLRQVLHYHCDLRMLKTRQLMHELQTL